MSFREAPEVIEHIVTCLKQGLSNLVDLDKTITNERRAEMLKQVGQNDARYNCAYI